MNNILVAGRNLSNFATSTSGTSTITKNSDGSWQFDSKDTLSKSYGYYQFPAIEGETINLTVTAVALAATNTDGSNAPMIAVRWCKKDGTFINSSINYINSECVGTYTAQLTINTPVSDGDYVIVSFGHFAASLISGVFFDAQVNVSNSQYPTQRKIIFATVQLEASAAGELPIINYLTQFPTVKPTSISWSDNNTLLVQDDKLKLSPVYNNSWTVDSRLLASNVSNSDYFKQNAYQGIFNWDQGSFQITITDVSTGERVDWKTNSTKKTVIQFEVNSF